MDEISQGAKTIAVMMRHTRLVASFLRRLAHALEDRAGIHDLSKFTDDEFAGFVEINRIAREQVYFSPEYQASIKNQTVNLHYSRNSHHPEHHANGIDGMSLGDFIEMVADWKAASITYGKTSFEDSLKVQIERFGLKPEHIYLIKLIMDEIS